jgi:hypothetical protein
MRASIIASLSIVLFASCSGGGGGEPTGPGGNGGGGTAIPVTPKPSGDAGYSISIVDPPSGYSSNSANAVNDAGVIAGNADIIRANAILEQHAYARVGGTNVVLTSGSGISAANAISNGSTVYVVGFADTAASISNTVPIRWTLNGTEAPTQKVLENAFGNARGVNDNGDVTGKALEQPVIWLANGERIPVAMPAGFTSGTGRDINNAGHAVFVFNGQFSRGYLRLQSGDLIALPPATGDVQSFATGISEVTNGSVYVSGVSASDGIEHFQAVRWTVNLTSKAVSMATPLGYDTEAGSVSNDGVAPVSVVLPFVDQPELWTTTGLFTLRFPSGVQSVLASGVSPNGKLVAGTTTSSAITSAVLWTKP